MSEPTEHGSFTLFPLLPPELRRCIWEQCLPRSRFIRIDVLRVADRPCLEQPYPGSVCYENWTPSVAPEKPPAPTDRLKPTTMFYTITLHHCYSPSILLRINQEARKVATDVYRIRLPFCPFSSRDGRYRAVLPLDPEHDIVKFNLGLIELDLPAAFLHDTLAYDPRGLGLANIALISAFSFEGLHKLQLSELVDEGRWFRKSIANLKTIYIETEIIERSTPLDLWGIPLMAWVSDFHWQGPDRRPVEANLSKLTIRGMHPKEAREAWAQLETNFGIDRSASPRGPLEILHMGAREHFDFKGPRPISVEDMAEVVQKTKKTMPWVSSRMAAKLDPRAAPTGGFWVWPSDAFDNVPVSDDPGPYGNFVADMTGQPLPQLAVFDLPNRA